MVPLRSEITTKPNSMNRHRRSILRKIVKGLRDLLSPEIWDMVPESLKKYADEVQDVCDEEEEAMDSMPENMQMSERYDNMVDNVSDLSDANADLITIADEIEHNPHYDTNKTYKKDMNGVIGHIENAINR